MTWAFLSTVSFLAGIVLGYLLASERRSSFLASKRELSIQLRAPLDLEPILPCSCLRVKP